MKKKSGYGQRTVTEVEYLGVPLSPEGSEGLGSPTWGAVGGGDGGLGGQGATVNQTLIGKNGYDKIGTCFQSDMGGDS